MIADRKPTVVLLHGLARTHRSVARLRRHLEAAGYPTWARTYPSRARPIAELAADTAARIRADLGDGPLDAVTHSLGGILLRHMAALLPWRRAVMLAPPNGGSRVALAFRDHPLYRWFYGPAGQEVTHPVDEAWPAPSGEFAVIAGTRGNSVENPVSWVTRGLHLLDGVPSDGTVAVDETRLPGMRDFATVDVSHTVIMNDPRVRDLVVRFLERGSFG
jgi:triacylglycerol lipase